MLGAIISFITTNLWEPVVSGVQVVGQPVVAGVQLVVVPVVKVGYYVFYPLHLLGTGLYSFHGFLEPKFDTYVMPVLIKMTPFFYVFNMAIFLGGGIYGTSLFSYLVYRDYGYKLGLLSRQCVWDSKTYTFRELGPKGERIWEGELVYGYERPRSAAEVAWAKKQLELWKLSMEKERAGEYLAYQYKVQGRQYEPLNKEEFYNIKKSSVFKGKKV